MPGGVYLHSAFKINSGVNKMGIAIITGASSGLGSQFARELYGRGVRDFWFIARRGDRMQALARELGVDAKIICADLTSKEGIMEITAALEAERPMVDFLINAAGFGNFGRFDELKNGEAERMIDLNVKALVLITEMTVPYMARGGRIIQLGSSSAFTPLPNFNVYAASKAFVVHYSKALRFELKKYGISVTCFCPCWVNTEFIGVANKNPNASGPKYVFPIMEEDKVVRRCVRAAMRRRSMYVTNWFAKMQHVLYKLVPDGLLTRAWLLMQKKENK